MDHQVGVALIGIGDIGRRHATLLAGNPRARLVAAADAAVDRLGPLAALGVDGTTDWKAALARPGVDAVFITTPPHLHREMAIAALDARKHVFLEKPMTATKEDAEAIVARAKASDRVVLVGFQERHNIAFIEMRRAIREGALGDILFFRGTGRIPRKRLEKGWLFNTAHGGGAVMESSIHNWDLARWMTGQEFVRVYAEGHIMEKQGGRYEDTFAAIGRLDNGTLVEIEACFSLPDGATFDSRVEVVGTRGMAYYDVGRQPLLISSEVGFTFIDRTITGTVVPDLIHGGPEIGAYGREHEHFFDCIQHAATPAVSVEDSMRSLEVALAVVDSIRSGQPVLLNAGPR
ncbi:MAG: Gfo/Idh/MocA family protein [Armatimonadota bacterium]